MTLLEEVCHWEQALRSQMLTQARPNVANFFFLPEDPDVEISATSPAPCLLAWCSASCHDNNGLKL